MQLDQLLLQVAALAQHQWNKISSPCRRRKGLKGAYHLAKGWGRKGQPGLYGNFEMLGITLTTDKSSLYDRNYLICYESNFK